MDISMNNTNTNTHNLSCHGNWRSNLTRLYLVLPNCNITMGETTRVMLIMIWHKSSKQVIVWVSIWLEDNVPYIIEVWAITTQQWISLSRRLLNQHKHKSFIPNITWKHLREGDSHKGWNNNKLIRHHNKNSNSEIYNLYNNILINWMSQ